MRSSARKRLRDAGRCRCRCRPARRSVQAGCASRRGATELGSYLGRSAVIGFAASAVSDTVASPTPSASSKPPSRLAQW
jgi:hypothetical protein